VSNIVKHTKKQKPLWLPPEILTADGPQHKRINVVFRTDKLNIRANCFKVLAGKFYFLVSDKEAYVF
jgi:hypothetical protein